MEVQTELTATNQSNIQSNIHIQNISLRPAWYGKINWADWRTINPKYAEEYDKRKQNTFILDYYDEYISPIYNERREHINMMSEHNKNTKQINNLTNYNNNNQDDFLIYTKKTKIYKNYSVSNTNMDDEDSEDQTFYNNYDACENDTRENE